MILSAVSQIRTPQTDPELFESRHWERVATSPGHLRITSRFHTLFQDFNGPETWRTAGHPFCQNAAIFVKYLSETRWQTLYVTLHINEAKRSKKEF
jgi:hypothetical protein